jgi:hypothetical protein
MRIARNLAFLLMVLAGIFAHNTTAKADICSNGVGLSCGSCCYFTQSSCEQYNAEACRGACHDIGCEYDFTFCPLNPFNDMYCPYCICKEWGSD